jgi:hypothetical protein
VTGEDRVPDDPQTGEVPDEELAPDEPQAVEDPGTTAEEQREGGSLDQRLDEEEPDSDAEERERAGRLVEEGWGLTDAEKDEVADAAEAEEDLSAEEDAVRVDDQAPGGVDGPDSYVQEDES